MPHHPKYVACSDHSPCRQYDPDLPRGQRFSVLAASSIYRLYHSVALLLPDGSVLVAGSEQSTCDATCTLSAPFLRQFQAERFLPFYFFGQEADSRPSIALVSASTAPLGGSLTINYAGSVTSIAITSPAAITHQIKHEPGGGPAGNHGQLPGGKCDRAPAPCQRGGGPSWLVHAVDHEWGCSLCAGILDQAHSCSLRMNFMA